MNQQEIIASLVPFAQEIQGLLKKGKSLREISGWTYKQREAGEKVIYLCILQTEAKPSGKVTLLSASPTRKQKDLFAFFEEKAPGSVLSRFNFYVTPEGVSFTERLESGSSRDLLAVPVQMPKKEEAPTSQGHFEIQAQATKGSTKGPWFRIWESQDGADCAKYLQSTTINENRKNVQYRMIYVPSVAK